MSILSEYHDYSRSKRGTKMLSLSCDNCGIEFCRKASKVHLDIHFCTKKCANSSSQSLEKRRFTNLTRYGASYGFQSEEVKQRRKSTMIDRYGTEHALRSPEIFAGMIVKHVEKYGVEHPLQRPEVIQKVKATNLAKYGHECVFGSALRQNFDFSKAKQREHATKKANGTYTKSRVEDEFYNLLASEFPASEIQRQVSVNGWRIDFKVKNVYIQFDGEYWHGLDRPISQIKEFKSPRDRVIYQTYLRDIQQNEWFNEHALQLIRITDKEYKSSNFNLKERLSESSIII